MKLFSCVDHASVWVGGASIIVAENETIAKELLKKELIKAGLSAEEFTLQEVDLTIEKAIILRNGDY